jgi:hypothetical protein
LATYNSDGTIWFGTTDSSGYRATITACKKHKKPVLIVQSIVTTRRDVLECLKAQNVRVLNVAGNRQSKNLGIGEQVEEFLSRVFTQLGQDESI